MKRLCATVLGFLIAALGLVSLISCASPSAKQTGSADWVTLLDSSNMGNWDQIGNANWRLVDGAVQADKGVGYLVSKESYADFSLRVEFWADADANSGVFLRLSDTKVVTATNSYEVNIFDKRPEQAYGTGAIVDVAKVPLPIPRAAGKWNVYDITAKGTQLTVKLNGVQTVDVQDSKHARGPIALQYAPGVVKDAGTIRFRKVQIKTL